MQYIADVQTVYYHLLMKLIICILHEGCMQLDLGLKLFWFPEQIKVSELDSIGLTQDLILSIHGLFLFYLRWLFIFFSRLLRNPHVAAPACANEFGLFTNYILHNLNLFCITFHLTIFWSLLTSINSCFWCSYKRILLKFKITSCSQHMWSRYLSFLFMVPSS